MPALGQSIKLGGVFTNWPNVWASDWLGRSLPPMSAGRGKYKVDIV